MIKRSSESILYFNSKKNVVTKIRLRKPYLVMSDRIKLAKSRTLHEYKILKILKEKGINVPNVYYCKDYVLKLEYLKSDIFPSDLSEIGVLISQIHKLNVVHNDLNVNNILYSNNRFFLIDFSLAITSSKTFDKISDFYLLINDLQTKGVETSDIISAYKKNIDYDYDAELNSYLVLRRYSKSNS